jgi:hypothetical protein
MKSLAGIGGAVRGDCGFQGVDQPRKPLIDCSARGPNFIRGQDNSRACERYPRGQVSNSDQTKCIVPGPEKQAAHHRADHAAATTAAAAEDQAAGTPATADKAAAASASPATLCRGAWQNDLQLTGVRRRRDQRLA